MKLLEGNIFSRSGDTHTNRSNLVLHSFVEKTKRLPHITKIQVTEMILVHASVIYQIPWIRWIDPNFCSKIPLPVTRHSSYLFNSKYNLDLILSTNSVVNPKIYSQILSCCRGVEKGNKKYNNT